ncbi:hypothetical protein JIG36_41700 [Actinoplanes sp. LDG1-06]|uniref:Uncharacterized protein n=1 Tax=Paractinoplanes ovalisporus TaxID=2810368 RepID=A0ABS2AQL9_9ACTN|nr:hypothetical protein [Actinoplanes ovalisporus]MBM2622038.1 hypothetical protein [Actinoplanes ovalisporus]
MIWEEMLRRRVEERCGDPGEAFAPYGYRFGKWLDADPATRADRDVVQVRDAVAGYLGGAVREGRLVGTVVGVGLGTAGALIVFLLVWAVA